MALERPAVLCKKTGIWLAICLNHTKYVSKLIRRLLYGSVSLTSSGLNSKTYLSILLFDSFSSIKFDILSDGGKEVKKLKDMSKAIKHDGIPRGKESNLFWDRFNACRLFSWANKISALSVVRNWWRKVASFIEDIVVWSSCINWLLEQSLSSTQLF